MSFKPTPELKKELEGWTTHYPYPIMGLLEALRSVQTAYRCIPADAEVYLAELFKTSVSHVHQVATFFPSFTQKPAGEHRVGICHGLSCAMKGAGQLSACLEKTLGVKEKDTTPDGRLSWEEMECIGACELAPAVLLDERLMGRGSEAMMEALARDPKSVKPDLSVGQQLQQDDAPKILTKHFANADLHTLEGYRKVGGYTGLAKARGMAPQAVADEVKKSNLRGLGGAGFPVGMKWGTVPPVDKAPERFVVANYDESEPGCFKDRVLGTRAPHQILEGLLIAAHAISAKWAFIFIRGEYRDQYDILKKAIAEMEAAGLNGEVTVRLMRGAGAYICGLDTALLETMEGKKAWPRQPPPFPTVAGLMAKPTVVNNVETLSMLPHIINHGGQWFADLGFKGEPEKKLNPSGGTGVFSVSGDVEKPGIYEFPMGSPLKAIIEAAGGVKGGKKLKAVIPGGTSTPPLTAEELGMGMDFDHPRAFGTFLGAGGVVILDETRDMVEVSHNIERFLAHESCGQCTPCREGSEWTVRILERAMEGRVYASDLPNLQRVGENITGKVICALGDTVGMVVRGYMKKFPDDFKKLLEAKKQ
jgi:NADH:ubiquinone oxidoreductase subunit F (NADH-binding)/NADH:ubiquinone oxidoreductase subunit E